MKEYPFLFNAPMVRAILNGTKTQTRREFKAPNGGLWPNINDRPGMKQLLRECKYGQPGDRLWVREAYFGNHYLHPHEPEDERELHYRADGYETFEGERITWRPSIHMPRWASRILLEIVSVRLERLLDISEDDAAAEGVEPYRLPVHPGRERLRHVDGFSTLWESINGPGSWDANPWVWVVEFKRVTP